MRRKLGVVLNWFMSKYEALCFAADEGLKKLCLLICFQKVKLMTGYVFIARSLAAECGTHSAWSGSLKFVDRSVNGMDSLLLVSGARARIDTYDFASVMKSSGL